MTGGQELSEDALASNPWRLDGLKMPVATKAIWDTVALIAIGLFLTDVAVRRVRIDIPAMARAVGKTFNKSKVTTGVQATNLRAAREQAKQRMEGGTPQEQAGAETPAVGQAVPPIAAGAKFEAAEDLVGKKTDPVALGGEAEKSAPVPKPKDEKTAKPEEEGMSRLRKAKMRAKDEFDDQGDQAGRG